MTCYFYVSYEKITNREIRKKCSFYIYIYIYKIRNSLFKYGRLTEVNRYWIIHVKIIKCLYISLVVLHRLWNNYNDIIFQQKHFSNFADGCSRLLERYCHYVQCYTCILHHGDRSSQFPAVVNSSLLYARPRNNRLRRNVGHKLNPLH